MVRTVAKQEFHPDKVMCAWWNMLSIIHFELLSPDQTIMAEVYCYQLQRLRAALLDKHPTMINRNGMLSHGDNTRQTCGKL